MIAHCPVLTTFYGDGGIGNFSTTTKLGGLVYQQTSNTSDVALWPARFEDVMGARSMSTVYGSDMQSFASRGFVWASQLDFSIVCAQANKVGAVYIGSILLSQLQGTTATTGPTFKDLIEIAEKAETTSKGFTLRAAIVNNDLVNQQEAKGTNILDPAFSGEIIQYAII